mmetsp:Transcript_13640/g.17774  ORF Transcript_13640/g.17774 Transcript_13640/m.17774 type:complete len:403 (-) Transcript_13640:133-1341(-)
MLVSVPAAPKTCTKNLARNCASSSSVSFRRLATFGAGFFTINMLFASASSFVARQSASSALLAASTVPASSRGGVVGFSRFGLRRHQQQQSQQQQSQHHERRQMSTTDAKRTTTTRQSQSFFSSEAHAGGDSDFATSSSSSSSNVVVLDPLVVCGPSGVGKGTIIERFMERQQQKQQHQAAANSMSTWASSLSSSSSNMISFGFSVSHTTRDPRPGEQDGVHYHFVNQTTMQTLMEQDFFVEFAQVHGNYYGTSWNALQAVQQQTTNNNNNNQKCLLDIDVQGVKRLQQLQKTTTATTATTNQQQQQPGEVSFILQPKYIFIAPPSLATLQERLKARNTETEESLKTRLANAQAEVEFGTSNSNDNKNHDNFDAVIVNQDLDVAVQEFEQEVYRLYNTNTNK